MTSVSLRMRCVIRLCSLVWFSFDSLMMSILRFAPGLHRGSVPFFTVYTGTPQGFGAYINSSVVNFVNRLKCQLFWVVIAYSSGFPLPRKDGSVDHPSSTGGNGARSSWLKHVNPAEHLCSSSHDILGTPQRFCERVPGGTLAHSPVVNG